MKSKVTQQSKIRASHRLIVACACFEIGCDKSSGRGASRSCIASANEANSAFHCALATTRAIEQSSMERTKRRSNKAAKHSRSVATHQRSSNKQTYPCFVKTPNAWRATALLADNAVMFWLEANVSAKSCSKASSS